MITKPFKTGEVIRARIPQLPVVFHYGIIVYHNNQPYVLHNPIDGGPTMDTLPDFFNQRDFEISFGRLTKKTDEQLLNDFNKVKTTKYDILHWNCEDFINYLIGYFKFQKGKIQFAICIIVAFALITIAINKLSKND